VSVARPFAGVPPRVLRMSVSWALALALLGWVFQLADYAYRRLPRPHPLEELSYYPSGVHLRPATLGHAETAADLAWLRAVQYYGEHRSSDMRFARMDHVFDILTTLSPHFISAYVFGAFALAQEGGQFQRAEQLMLKGLEANPTSGPLAFELGFLYYVRPGGRDLRRAAEYFEQAARQPDAPAAAWRFAAFARQHSGDLRVAYELWADVARNSDNPYLAKMAEREMRKIRRAIESGRTDLAVRRLTTPVVRIGR
jgi:TPR repeat protein